MGTISRRAINAVVGLVASTAMAVKVASMRFATRASWYVSGLGRTSINYSGAVGDGRGNAIVMACVLWVTRTFTEAPLRLQKMIGGQWEQVDAHPLLSILRRPNPYYGSRLLWKATLADWMLDGNAYWVKVRNRGGRPLELWWVPTTMMEPSFPDDGSVFISHYTYTPTGRAEAVELAVEDVIHFRNSPDPNNQRKGLSPLRSLMREIFTDDESANYSASLLRNSGMPGVILSPEVEDASVDAEMANSIKAEFAQRFGGDNRGMPMVMMGKTKVDVIGFNPQQMDLKVLRRLPEERISAIFGTPAVVVGLGAGLDRSTFANFKEAREAAYESNIIPTQGDLAEQLMMQLLPDFVDEGQLDNWMIDFDLRQVRVLQEDENARTMRVMAQLAGGSITLNEAREKQGDDKLEGDTGEVYYIPSNIAVTRAADMGAEPEPPAPVMPPLMPEDEPAEDDADPLAERVRSNGHSREAVAA